MKNNFKFETLADVFCYVETEAKKRVDEILIKKQDASSSSSDRKSEVKVI